MTNHRTAIREQARTMLAGATLAGAKVFTNRARPITPNDMPALLIYTGASRRGDRERDGSMVHRRLELVVEGAVAATGRGEELEAQLEQLAEQVETALAADPTLGGLVLDARWQSTDPDIVGDGRQLVGAVRVEFELELHTHHDSAGRWIDAFGNPAATPGELLVAGPAEPDTDGLGMAAGTRTAPASGTIGIAGGASDSSVDAIIMGDFNHGGRAV